MVAEQLVDLLLGDAQHIESPVWRKKGLVLRVRADVAQVPSWFKLPVLSL